MRKIPCPVYELQEQVGKQINGQFYAEELSPVHITKRLTYGIDTILRKRVQPGILEYLVRWRGYNSDFDLWITTSSVKNDQRSKPLLPDSVQ